MAFHRQGHASSMEPMHLGRTAGQRIVLVPISGTMRWCFALASSRKPETIVQDDALRDQVVLDAPDRRQDRARWSLAQRVGKKKSHLRRAMIWRQSYSTERHEFTPIARHPLQIIYT